MRAGLFQNFSKNRGVGKSRGVSEPSVPLNYVFITPDGNLTYCTIPAIYSVQKNDLHLLPSDCRSSKILKFNHTIGLFLYVCRTFINQFPHTAGHENLDACS